MGVPISAFSALNSQHWPFPLSALPRPVYLVGGIVRDALLGRQPDYLDLDFVVPENAIELARQIARTHQAGFVVLDAERQIARVVFPQATVDFALQEGLSLEADLGRRDFTVNAMAYNPHSHELVDPLGGHLDLQRRCLRMVSAHNLAEDPLRLLRAYRQSAQLNFQLEAATQACIAQLGTLITQVAAERVQSELSYLFHHPQGTSCLVGAWQAGLLSPWFPAITPLHIARLVAMDPLIAALAQRWVNLPTLLQLPLKQKETATKPEGLGRSLWGFLRLCILLDANPDQAENTLRTLKASRWEMRSAALLWRLLPQVQRPHLTIREQYFLYKEAQDLWPALMLLAIVCRTEPDASLSDLPTLCLDQMMAELEQGTIVAGLDQFFDPNNLIAHPRPLVTGREVMQELSLPSSPQIGEILTEIQLAQAAGQIDTLEAALAFARQWLKSHS